MVPGTVKRSIVASINETSTSTSRMSPSLKWGIDNEHVAHEMCKSKRGEEVADCGLIINPSWLLLACSPNSIFHREANPLGAIEIKCPFSNKEMTIEECCKDSSFYLKKNPDGVITLKQSHVYYYQCQGALNITGLDWRCCIYEERFFCVMHTQRYWVVEIKDASQANNVLCSVPCGLGQGLQHFLWYL